MNKLIIALCIITPIMNANAHGIHPHLKVNLPNVSLPNVNLPNLQLELPKASDYPTFSEIFPPVSELIPNGSDKTVSLFPSGFLPNLSFGDGSYTSDAGWRLPKCDQIINVSNTKPYVSICASPPPPDCNIVREKECRENSTTKSLDNASTNKNTFLDIFLHDNRNGQTMYYETIQYNLIPPKKIERQG